MELPIHFLSDPERVSIGNVSGNPRLWSFGDSAFTALYLCSCCTMISQYEKRAFLVSLSCACPSDVYSAKNGINVAFLFLVGALAVRNVPHTTHTTPPHTRPESCCSAVYIRSHVSVFSDSSAADATPRSISSWCNCATPLFFPMKFSYLFSCARSLLSTGPAHQQPKRHTFVFHFAKC